MNGLYPSVFGLILFKTSSLFLIEEADRVSASRLGITAPTFIFRLFLIPHPVFRVWQ